MIRMAAPAAQRREAGGRERRRRLSRGRGTIAAMSRLRLLPLILLLGGCIVPGYRGLWQPKPAEVLATGDGGVVLARLSVAVLGKWRGDPYDGEVHVRFRVENVGSEPLRVPLARCELFSGDLLSFGAPRLVAGDEAELPPGASETFDAGFAPPAEDADLRGLQARWVLVTAGHELPGSLTFSYVVQDYYSPYYYGSVSYGYGWGWGGSGCWGWNGCVIVPIQPVQALPPHTMSVPPKP